MKLGALRRLNGALIAVPIVNVPGFLNLSRYLPDRRDLNRSFPWSARGSLAAPTRQDVPRPSPFKLYSRHRSSHRCCAQENFPQIRVDLDNRAAQCMARAFGVSLVVNAASRKGSLRGAANELNVPVIVYEAGEALRFDEAAIRTGVRGLVRVMESLDMLPARKRDSGSRAPMILRSSSWVRAPSSGVVRAKKPIGAHIEVGGTCCHFRSLGRGRYRDQIANGCRRSAIMSA